jgi:hypothetical protein
MPDQGHGGLDGEAEPGPARNVQREVSTHVNAGEANDRRGSGNDGAPGRAQSREDSRAQGDRHARVSGQVPQPGRSAATGVGAADQLGCR